LSLREAFLLGEAWFLEEAWVLGEACIVGETWFFGDPISSARLSSSARHVSSARLGWCVALGGVDDVFPLSGSLGLGEVAFSLAGIVSLCSATRTTLAVCGVAAR
jgi:hypothetical protein